VAYWIAAMVMKLQALSYGIFLTVVHQLTIFRLTW